jgi:hypothetical protein
VIGCAGSGKTTLARELAARLDALHVERDALGDDEAPGFAALVAAAVEAAGPRWVFDGAPYNAEQLVYPHVNALVALDYPRRVVCRRVMARSLRLWLTRRGDGAPQLHLPAVEVVGAYPPGALGCADTRRTARGNCRALCEARGCAHPAIPVHLPTPDRDMAQQSSPLNQMGNCDPSRRSAPGLCAGGGTAGRPTGPGWLIRARTGRKRGRLRTTVQPRMAVDPRGSDLAP